MTKGKRYKKSQKKYANFFFFYVIIACTVFICYTFSRYTTTVESEDSSIGIAKFNVTVNGKNVGADIPFELHLSTNEKTYKNKIAPDIQQEYFEIIIDPTETEVSLEYEFIFDLDNIDKDINITKYTVNDGENINVDGNIIKGDILLPSTDKAFEAKDAINIKVYWEWNEDIINPNITNEDLDIICTVRQKIN